MSAASRLSLAMIMFVAFTHPANPQNSTFESNVDRPGLDYRDFDLVTPDPMACQSSCTFAGGCRAWTYVKPGVQGPNARCWLKSAVPNAVASNCCVSGVVSSRVTQPPARICPGLPGPPLEQTRVLHMNAFGGAKNFYFNAQHGIYCGYGAIHTSEFSGEYLRQEGNGFVGYELVNDRLERRTYYNRERTVTAPNGKIWDEGHWVSASDPRRTGGWRAAWN